MSQTQTFILAIGGFQGFLLFLLLVSDKRVNYASKLLGVYCLLLAANIVLPLIVAAGASRFSWLIGYLLFLPACFGALSYLYCRSAMTGSSLKLSDAFHLLPLLLCYVLNVDLLLSGQRALEFIKTPKSELVLFKLTLVIFYGQAIFYAVLLARTIIHYQSKARQTLASYNPDTFKWHWSLLIFMVTIWSLKAVSSSSSMGHTINFIADCLLVVLIYFFAIAQWRNPSLFHIRQLSEQLESTDAQRSQQPVNGALDQGTRSQVYDLVKQRVEQEALYRDSELTLASLAQHVGVSVHHLSETLNQQGGKNFNQFINEYRVAEVCQNLKQQSERTVIDLALDAGFSSKSSFNAIFKKITGQTPSIYRQQSLQHG